MIEDGPGSTEVTVLTEMQVTGKAAQFGRGGMADVGDKILGQFASCLAEEFADAPTAPPVAESTGDLLVAGGGPGAADPRPSEAIDLLDACSAAVTERLVPVAAGVGVLVLLMLALRLARRRESGGGEVLHPRRHGWISRARRGES